MGGTNHYDLRVSHRINFKIKGIIPRQIQASIDFLSSEKTFQKLYSDEFEQNQISNTDTDSFHIYLKENYSNNAYHFIINDFKKKQNFEKELNSHLEAIYNWMDEKKLPDYKQMVSKGIYSMEIDSEN